jgi:hypothetical protein
MLSLHNIKKTDPLQNGEYLWASLTIGLLQADNGTVHLLQKETMAATSYISSFILNITLQAILGRQAN